MGLLIRQNIGGQQDVGSTFGSKAVKKGKLQFTQLLRITFLGTSIDIVGMTMTWYSETNYDTAKIQILPASIIPACRFQAVGPHAGF